MFNKLSLVDYNAIGSAFDNGNRILSKKSEAAKKSYNDSMTIVNNVLSSINEIESGIQSLLQDTNDLLLLNRSDSDNIVTIPLLDENMIENYRTNTANGSISLSESSVVTSYVSEIFIGSNSNFVEDPENKLKNMSDGNFETYAGILSDVNSSISGSLIFRMPKLSLINGFYFEVKTESNDAFIIGKVYASKDGDIYEEVQSHSKVIVNGKVKISLDLINAMFIKIDISYSGRNSDGKSYVKLYDVFTYNATYFESGYVTYKIALPDVLYNISLYDITADRIAPNTNNDISISISADNNKWLDITAAPIHANLPWDSSSLTISDIAYIKIELTNKLLKEDLGPDYRQIVNDKHAFNQNIKLSSTPISNIKLYNNTPIKIGRDTIFLGLTRPGVDMYIYDVGFDLSNTMITVGGVGIALEDKEMLSSSISAYYDTSSKKLFISLPSKKNTIYIDPYSGYMENKFLSEQINNNNREVIEFNKVGVGQNAAQELVDTLKQRKEVKLTFLKEYVSKQTSSIELFRDPFNNENSITITAVEHDNSGDVITTELHEILPAGSTRIQLSYIPMINDTYDLDLDINTGSKVEYIDGIAEFVGMFEVGYSYDEVNNIVYFSGELDIDIAVIYTREEKYIIPHSDFSVSGKTIIVDEMWMDDRFAYEISYDWSHSLLIDRTNVGSDNAVIISKDELAQLSLLKRSGDNVIISSYEKQFINDSEIALLFTHRTPEVFNATIGIINRII